MDDAANARRRAVLRARARLGYRGPVNHRSATASAPRRWESTWVRPTAEALSSTPSRAPCRSRATPAQTSGSRLSTARRSVHVHRGVGDQGPGRIQASRGPRDVHRSPSLSLGLSNPLVNPRAGPLDQILGCLVNIGHDAGVKKRVALGRAELLQFCCSPYLLFHAANPTSFDNRQRFQLQAALAPRDRSEVHGPEALRTGRRHLRLLFQTRP